MRMIKASLLAVWCFAAFLVSANTAHIDVEQAQARATFALAKTGAVYMTLVNQATQPDTLVAVSVSSDVANEAQIHSTKMVGEVMQMRELEAGIELAPKQPVELMPGGMHIMLMGLSAPLSAGESFTLTLHFDKAPAQEVSVKVVDFNR